MIDRDQGVDNAADNMAAHVIRHTGGFVEIMTNDGLLLMTSEEHQTLLRRGASVTLNRGYVAENQEA